MGDFMAVSKKGRRKIIRGGRVFYWCVRHDDEDRLYLVIESDDRHRFVSYMLGQRDFSPAPPLIIVKGKKSEEVPGLGRGRERFVAPDWDDSAVTPALVGQIIDWCFAEEAVTSAER